MPKKSIAGGDSRLKQLFPHSQRTGEESHKKPKTIHTKSTNRGARRTTDKQYENRYAHHLNVKGVLQALVCLQTRKCRKQNVMLYRLELGPNMTHKAVDPPPLTLTPTLTSTLTLTLTLKVALTHA